jgi:galactokinase
VPGHGDAGAWLRRRSVLAPDRDRRGGGESRPRGSQCHDRSSRSEIEVRSRSLDAFREQFVRSPDFFVRAPGRVNLIGEHTDYNAGLALPCAIDRELWAAVAAREDDVIRVWSADLGPQGRGGEFQVTGSELTGGFLDYVKGAIAALVESDVCVRGLDLAIASDLPIGSGLASSAALGVATCMALLHAAGEKWPPRTVALAATRGESHFVGTGCGILDPFAIALGRRNRALRIDCRTQQVDAVSFPHSRVGLLISHSGVTRRLAATGDSLDPGAGYRERVAQCRAALAAAKRANSGCANAQTLRDVPIDALAELEGAMDPILFRRLRHVVSEIARVEACCKALERGGEAELKQVGACLRAGHESLRDDFEVSIPEIDALCEDADQLEGVHGSRLTGAGFGGCALHLVASDAIASVREELAERFHERFGRTLSMLTANPARGASIESA